PAPPPRSPSYRADDQHGGDRDDDPDPCCHASLLVDCGAPMNRCGSRPVYPSVNPKNCLCALVTHAISSYRLRRKLGGAPSGLSGVRLMMRTGAIGASPERRGPDQAAGTVSIL